MSTATRAPPISEPGTGFVSDRQAAPPGIRYFVSQQDRFGRWSKWAARNAGPGPRPKPPRPEFQAFYTQPSIADAASTGGEIFVKVAVPKPEALAPGSHLLDHLDLDIEDLSGAPTVTLSEPEANKTAFPADPNTLFLRITHTGPILQPTEIRQLKLTARWIDTANVPSDDSVPQTLTLHDPRPPAPVVVPDRLQYSARPDVTGLSWVEYRWTPQAGQARFGIYYSDENRLRSHLIAENETAVVAALDAAPNLAARTTVYRDNTALFPDHLFERLRDVNVTLNSGEEGFRHAVSGSLRVLNFYKVAAEAESGAKPVLTDVEMIVYGVPNSDPPPRPVVKLSPLDTPLADHAAKVGIEVLAGTTLGERWRLRRSSVESANIAKMPVVETGTLSLPEAETGIQSGAYDDIGPVQIAPGAKLRPWVRYTWVAEIQGAPEPGSVEAGMPVPGRWSQPSDPVSLILVPGTAPAPPTIATITGVAVPGGYTGLTLTLEHPNDELTGGELGSYRVRVARRIAPTDPLQFVQEADISGHEPFVLSGVLPDDAAETVPVDTEYVVELVDPLGRTSAQATATVI